MTEDTHELGLIVSTEHDADHFLPGAFDGRGCASTTHPT